LIFGYRCSPAQTSGLHCLYPYPNRKPGILKRSTFSLQLLVIDGILFKFNYARIGIHLGIAKGGMKTNWLFEQYPQARAFRARIAVESPHPESLRERTWNE
jgi:hypothetical protein